MGFLNLIMYPFFWAMSGIIVGFHWLYSQLLDPNSGWTWTLSIVSLTVVIRTLMIPLFVRQINSSRKMQLVAPKAKALQEKYGQDRERYGQEVMKLYQEEGVNPMASCLPLLIQMPIFIALFRVLQGVADGHIRGTWLRNAPELVDSLQNATIFGARIAGTVFPITPFGATQVVGIILVIAMVGTFFVTQLQLQRKNMPPEALTGQAAQMQKMMLYFFPIIYAVSAVVVPIGVLLYWLTSNLWTMGQQGLLIRNNPAPNTPAYIDWEERMLAKGRDPEAIVLERAAKRRKNKTKEPLTSRLQKAAEGAGTSSTSTAETETEGPKIVRQQVTRQTVRTTEDGRRIVTRQSPKSQPRSSRKKK